MEDLVNTTEFKHIEIRTADKTVGETARYVYVDFKMPCRFAKLEKPW